MTPVTESDPNAVTTMGPIPKPYFNSQILKVSKIFLWNSGGKKMQFPKDVTPPKTMVIDKITIYIQMLTSDETKSLGVKGWDAVLAEIEGYKPEVTECKIANFWANWRHNRVMARKFKNQTKPTQDPTAEAAGSDPTKTPQDPTAAAAGSNTTNGKDTPSVDAIKRKRTDTPSSAEPQSNKLSYTEAFANARPAGHDPKPKKTAHTLWVHTNNLEKGPISRDYFFEVVSHCNAIKVKGLLQGQSEFS